MIHRFYPMPCRSRRPATPFVSILPPWLPRSYRRAIEIRRRSAWRGWRVDIC